MELKMTQTDFCHALKNILECDCEILPDTDLTALEEYDSLFMLGLISFCDKNFGIKCDPEQLKSAPTPAALIKVIGEKFFT